MHNNDCFLKGWVFVLVSSERIIFCPAAAQLLFYIDVEICGDFLFGDPSLYCTRCGTLDTVAKVCVVMGACEEQPGEGKKWDIARVV